MKKFLIKHRRKLIITLVLLVASGFILKKTFFKPKPEFIFAEAQIKDISQTLEVSGVIQAEDKAILKFQALGKLNWVGVKLGDKVSKWQAIASLDKTILKKTLEKELNDYLHQRKDFDQIREDNLVTTDNYDEYSFENTIERLILQEQYLLNNTVLDVEVQNLTNKLATLISPIEGVVTQIDTPIAGVNITPTDKFEIVNPQTLYFEVEIDEVDISSIALGQQATILLESFPDHQIASQVTWVDFSATTDDSGGIIFLTKLSIPLTQIDQYRLGMTGDASIILDQKSSVLTVPIDAINQDNDRTFVKILAGKQVKEINVETGLESDDYIEILSGLSAGDQVITGEKKQ